MKNNKNTILGLSIALAATMGIAIVAPTVLGVLYSKEVKNKTIIKINLSWREGSANEVNKIIKTKGLSITNKDSLVKWLNGEEGQQILMGQLLGNSTTPSLVREISFTATEEVNSFTIQPTVALLSGFVEEKPLSPLTNILVNSEVSWKTTASSDLNKIIAANHLIIDSLTLEEYLNKENGENVKGLLNGDTLPTSIKSITSTVKDPSLWSFEVNSIVTLNNDETTILPPLKDLKIPVRLMWAAGATTSINSIIASDASITNDVTLKNYLNTTGANEVLKLLDGDTSPTSIESITFEVALAAKIGSYLITPTVVLVEGAISGTPLLPLPGIVINSPL